MKLLFKFLLVVGLLLAGGFVYLWATIPLNTPWRAMAQQLSALPDWALPEPLSAKRAGSVIRAADGYGVEVFASGLFDARVLLPTETGAVLVSIPRRGEVLLLAADENGDGASDGQRVLLDGLRRPYGLAFRGGHLYVGEEDGIGRIEFDQRSGAVAGSYVRIVDDLPAGGSHWRNPIRFGPDGKLYVTIGSSCNVCIEEDVRRAAMLRFTADGDYLGVYASGLRNAVGFDWRQDGRLFATDNGRDLLGDDFPPCELNVVVEGGFYGWPFANGARIPDPDFGGRRDAAIDASIPPVHEFRPHNAPLGMVFLRGANHPTGYQGAAVVALHGSWNRTEKDGYKVVSVHFDEAGRTTERDFLWGFLRDGNVLGRPAEVAESSDGSVYVADDYGGAIFRVRPGTGASVDGQAPGSRSEGYQPASVSPSERAAALAQGPGLMAAGGCLGCHVPNARPPDSPVALKVLDGLATRYTLAELAEYLGQPNPPMPPYTGSAGDRRTLALYLLESY
jgi:glucose/arabinose dehydrogenase